MLIVTFDISRDGRTDIAPDRAVKLLEAIDAEFEPVAAPRPSELIGQVGADDALTTTWARRVHPESVPWRRTWRSSLGALKRLSWPSAVFFDCTVCCTVHRRSHDA
jgi:hypothetical protein